MPTTSDPVSVAEIAERCGVDANAVKQWVTRGSIPPADWKLKAGGLWAWEGLAVHPHIEKRLDPLEFYRELVDTTRRHLADAGYVIAVPDERDRPRHLAARIEKRGHGWVSVPVPARRRWFVSSDPAIADEDDGRVSSAQAAVAELELALGGLRDLFAAGERREPSVSASWSS